MSAAQEVASRERFKAMLRRPLVTAPGKTTRPTSARGSWSVEALRALTFWRYLVAVGRTGEWDVAADD